MIRRIFILLGTHVLVGALGFALGIYILPILTAPDSPPAAQVTAALDSATYTTTFKRNLKGSDAFHWGEGRVGVSKTQIAFDGEMAPGPNYQVYLTKEFVDDNASFERIKKDSLRVGEVKTFDRFLVDLPGNVDVNEYTTVVVWCERFSQFISAGQYRSLAMEQASHN